jgi:hypothetical protein
MKQALPVLGLLLGLGSCFSIAQAASPTKDPLARHMAGVKAGTPEPALQKFATGCNVDVSKILPRYAAGPGSSFTPINDLAKGLRTLDTDFYSTAEVWASESRVLVEMWANSDDVGSEVRYYECFAAQELMQAEVIEWDVPMVQSPHVVTWGYSRRWERGENGRMQRTKAEFVDEIERPIPKPKLDADGERYISWTPSLGPLSELKLPPALLH